MIQYSVTDGLCVLRLDAPPLNTITFALLDALRVSLRRASEDAQVLITAGLPVVVRSREGFVVNRLFIPS